MQIEHVYNINFVLQYIYATFVSDGTFIDLDVRQANNGNYVSGVQGCHIYFRRIRLLADVNICS